MWDALVGEIMVEDLKGGVYVNFNKISWWFLIVGGLNWGLEALGVGLQSLVPLPSGVYTLLFLLVGLSALYQMFGKKA